MLTMIFYHHPQELILHTDKLLSADLNLQTSIFGLLHRDRYSQIGDRPLMAAGWLVGGRIFRACENILSG
jgi:hypothetical protein